MAGGECLLLEAEGHSLLSYDRFSGSEHVGAVFPVMSSRLRALPGTGRSYKWLLQVNRLLNSQQTIQGSG